jgi:hypothetical protein
MKNVILFIKFSATLLLFFVTDVSAQNDSIAANAWIHYMTPNEVHKTLNDYSGKWDMEITMWTGPGQKPEIMKISSVNQMTIGGRFLEMDQLGDMMGMRYEAKTTLGFNTANQKMELSTINNMGTGTLYLSGLWDSKTETANLSGSLVNPVDKKVIAVRQVINLSDPNMILIQNYDKSGNEKERKSIQYLFTRKK